MEGTTNVIVLPGAAVQPVVNPVLRGRRARGGKVTLASDLARRRDQRKFAHVVNADYQVQAQQDTADECLA